MNHKPNFTSNLKLNFLYYFFLLDKSTLSAFMHYFNFYVELSLKYIFLEVIDWTENNFKLVVYWVIFVVIMSLCVRNEYGHDIETLHYIIFSIAMGYCIYLHKQFYPKDTRFLLIKLCIVCFMIIKVFWPLILYLWPFKSWIISARELKDLGFFIWIKDRAWKRPKGLIYFDSLISKIWKIK